MKVLVTGGAGFIGSHLVDGLLDRTHSVSVIDNESTGKRQNVSAQATYKKGDVSRLQDLEPIFSEGVDAVCHIAGQVSMIGSFFDPFTDLKTNTQGTLNVLQLCLKYKVSRLIYASSMTVYGETSSLPTPESTACQPCSYYGITKYAAERYVQSTALRSDLEFEFNVSSFRMFNVYGPRQALDNPYQGVLGIFLGNVLRGEPLTIFGDGTQSRDFVYVGDVVRAWVDALENPSTYGEIFNLGSGRRIDINQLADEVLEAYDLSRDNYDIRFLPARPGEQRHVEADLRRIDRRLGWQPRVSFPDGLAATVQWASTQDLIPEHQIAQLADP
jgi:UDP-glucose 4-epimerase